MNYTMDVRPIQKVEIDPNLIQSGDYFAIQRLDGLDPFVMYGSGAHSGHSVTALRFDGELYIIESQDAWYWPVHRIQRTLWKDWIQWAENASFHVVFMPLSDEMRAKYNETAAQEWFYKTDGLPYGYHTFLSSSIDTAEDSYPLLIPKDLFPILFGIMEKINKNDTDILFTAGLNFHLGTKGLDLAGIAAEGAKRGLNVSQIWAIPEQDGWEYDIFYHDGLSYVCSSYVTSVWKAAGLFDGLDINAVEFTPKDVYQVDFFNKNFTRPQACQAADPDQPWCQLLGKYRMTFPGFSSIKPYSHMNERCPSVAPDFYRPDGC